MIFQHGPSHAMQQALARVLLVLLAPTAGAPLAGCSATPTPPVHDGSVVAVVADRVTADKSSIEPKDAVPRASGTSPLSKPSAVISEQSSLDDCLAYAALHSPKLEAAYYHWQAALDRVAQVESLPDPRVSYAYYIESVETRVGPQRHLAGFQQTIPWLGKLAKRGDMQAQAAAVQYERYQETKLELFYRVKELYYELYYLRSAIELTRDNMALLSQFERIARAKYRVAAASHPDVVRVQVELGRLDERLRALEDRRQPLSARMNAVLDRPGGSLVPWPAEVTLYPLAVSEPDLLERAKRSNPNLRALGSDIEKARVAEKLAVLGSLPDFTFGVDYIATGDAVDSSISDSGQDAVIGRVSFSIPLWYEKHSAAEREATKHRTATAREQAHATNELVAAIEQALYELRDADRKVELFRGSLIPKAEESLRVSLKGFEGDKVSFLDLLDAERVLLEFQLLEKHAVSLHGRALARLEMLVGDDLSAAVDMRGDEEASP